MARLESICRVIVDGDWIESKDQSESGIRLIQTGNIGVGEYLDKSNRAKYITAETFERLKCTEVFPGDILISRLPDPIGRACAVPQNVGKAITAVDCTIVRLDSALCDINYFINYTQSVRYSSELSKFLAGTTRTRISRKNLEKIDIPLPSLEEQRRIAALLDKVSDLIAKRRAQLDKLDLLVKARFVEMFGDITANPKGWKKEKLQSHIDMITGFPFNSSGYSENGVKICGGLIIMPDQIKWDECKFWPDSLGYEQFLLQKDDIVVALDRPWISEGFKIGEIRAEDLPALLIQRTARIRGRNITQQFLLYLLKDKAFERHCTITGSLVPHISNKDINSYEVILPPYELQQQFEEFSHKIKSLKLTAQQSLDKLEIVKKALMQKYFG